MVVVVNSVVGKWHIINRTGKGACLPRKHSLIGPGKRRLYVCSNYRLFRCFCIQFSSVIAIMTSSIEIFTALLAICVGNSPITGEFPSQRPVTRNLDVLIYAWTNGWINNRDAGDLRRVLWRHCNAVAFSFNFHQLLHCKCEWFHFSCLCDINQGFLQMLWAHRIRCSTSCYFLLQSIKSQNLVFLVFVGLVFKF